MSVEGETIVQDDGILGGTPTFRGTRIPVYDVAASVAAGVSAARLKRAYPGLTDLQIETAMAYARTVPAPSRAANSRVAGLTPASERMVPRRRR